MAVKPMLDDVELQQVQEVEAEEQETLAQQSVPALDGDFLQDLGRRATRLSVSGVLSDDHAGEGLKKLREKFQTAAPVPFTADIAAATKVDKVLIEEIGVREVAGKPARFEYAFTLREFVPPPQPKVEPPPPPPPPPPSVDTGTLAVEVIVEGQPNFDFSTVTVSVDGTKDDGSPFSKTLANRANNVWTEDKMPPGQYTARAVVTDPPMSGSAGAAVRRGQTTKVTITLKAGPPVAVTFVVHFKFDKAFVEPCMLEVLKHVTDFATAHPDRKLLIVGHTDLVGSDDYNQSLSERRGRAVFAALTFGRDQAGAIAEWNVLRRRATGALPSVSDTWGTREYQYMLQDLGYYSGAIDEQHGPETDVAVRSFQQDQSLPVTGLVDDVTWSALIQAYLGQEPLSVPESQFFRNAANGCDGGIVKWLGCGEKDPVKNTQDAWRPNRRCEMLFVNADHIPCQVAKPVTFDLPAPGAGGTSWCLGPGDPKQRCCFTARKEPQPGKFLIQPVDPSTVVISGTITFEDGTPAANLDFVLTAPDGEYMNGERPTGRPIPGRTGGDGSFSFPGNPKHPGICMLEVLRSVLARPITDPPNSEHGTVVCFGLTSQGTRQGAVVLPPGTPRPAVNPIVTPASSVTVVKKPYTSPARQRVVLRASSRFPRPGTLARSSPAVRLFTAAANGTEITFNGTDNVFSGAQLTTGVELFAEGASPSNALDDVVLTLSLTPGSIPVGPDATATMTAVELTLDAGLTRTAPGVDPIPLSTNDKINVGRFVQVHDRAFSNERAMLIVRPPNPAAFSGRLVLTPIDVRVQAFAAEVPASGQAPLPSPVSIASPTVPPGGARFFAEATAVSTAVRDTGFRLGIEGLENEADRVAMTAVQIEAASIADVNAPALTFVRFGLWNQAYDATGNIKNGVNENDNFVGSDKRKFHFRLRDPAAAGHVSVDWRTLNADRTTDDDSPASKALTLPETAAGSKVFVSRAVMLVTDDTDRDFATDSGLVAPLDAGLRNSGQSNHRTRRANIDGFAKAEYQPSAGVRLSILVPAFNRNPDERKRVNARVVRYTNAADPTYVAATDAYIAGQFQHANQRWNQIGIQIDASATLDRQIPASALNAAGRFPFEHPNGPHEQAALADLIPLTPDNTLTVVFVHLTGANAYAAILPENPIPLPAGGTATIGDRFFIFINTNLALTDETLAHELHHVLFNRFDTATERRFFTLNTNSPTGLVIGTGIVLPDVRIYRRIQNLLSPDPDNDPANANIINWARRVRTARFPQPVGLAAADATTGNKFLQNF